MYDKDCCGCTRIYTECLEGKPKPGMKCNRNNKDTLTKEVNKDKIYNDGCKLNYSKFYKG